MKPTSRSPKRVPSRAIYLVVGGILGSALVLVLSPLALAAVAPLFDSNKWALLSSIGQSYTGPGTILTAGALAGVVWTAVLQNRQIHTGQQQAIRELQFRLLELAMSDPLLARWFVKSPFIQGTEHEEFRFATYLNMWLRHFEFCFVSGAVDETYLRELARNELFVSSEMRAQASVSLPAWIRTNPRTRVFIDILMQELERSRLRESSETNATDGDPPASPSPDPA